LDGGIRALVTALQPPHVVFPKQVSSCLGKPGDVVIANYMTAHLVAPNQSPNIRYACYFRIHSSNFGSDKPPGERWWEGRRHRPEAMLAPWCDWGPLREFEAEEEQVAQAIALSGGQPSGTLVSPPPPPALARGAPSTEEEEARHLALALSLSESER